MNRSKAEASVGTGGTVLSLLWLGALLLTAGLLSPKPDDTVPRQIAAKADLDVESNDWHGRTANNPAELGSAGWRDVIVRTYKEVQEDRLIIVAGGIAFYGLLSIFPGIAAIVSIYGLFAHGDTIREHLHQLSFLLPPDAFSIVDDQIRRVVVQGDGELGIKFVIGLLFALWSANSGVNGLIDGLNVAYEEEEKRTFIALNVLSLLMTVAALLSIIVLIAVVATLPAVFNDMLSSRAAIVGLSILRWPAMWGLFVAGLCLLYRFGPSREKAKWHWLSWGAAFAGAAIIVISLSLSWYLSNLADYNKTYGSLGAVIGLLIWMWLCATSILIGAELNAEMEHQTAKDTTTGAPKPMGQRGSKMADTLGHASL
jgi:membrane protein